MFVFLLLFSGWFVAGYAGARMLVRKGYNLEGINGAREALFVERSVNEIQPNARGDMQGMGSPSMAIVAVGCLITLMIALVLTPKERHLPR